MDRGQPHQREGSEKEAEIPKCYIVEPAEHQQIENRNPEDEASRREMSHLLEEAIDELPTIYRVVFMMR